MAFNEKQARMLKAGKFHFGSGRGDYDNHRQAGELEGLGLITVKVNQYEQEATYDCTVTAAGRAALASI